MTHLNKNQLMDDEQFFEQPEENQEIVEIKQLFPANPIYEKAVTKQDKPVLHIDLTRKNQIVTKQQLRPTFKKETEPDEEVEEPKQELHAFDKYFQGSKCVYKRYNNSQLNTYRGDKYYSSCFIDRRFFLQNKDEIRSLSQMHKEFFNENLKIANQKAKNEVAFDSDFQSGNLFAVFKKSGTEYDLILQNDINSKGNTQWFYFTVQNLPQNVEITFNIVNLLKSDSLFNYGMQPVVLSEAKLKKTGQSWTRQGRCISYFKNGIRRERSKRFYYTLTFKITSKIAGDKLRIAHCFPYTYTMLNEYLQTTFKTYQRKGLTLTKSIIGKSMGNNSLEVITVSELNPEKKPDSKSVVVVMARQHPGQSQGSYVCQGFINFLLQKSKEAEFLRKNFIFKIIPMLNPDGVIVGNYRSNLMGCDLNRKWDQFDKSKIFPEVSSVKSFISELNKQKKIRIILDLHGHSKKLNSFFYGNPYPQQPEYVRGFPYACSKLCDKISFQDCTFHIQESKKKAARVYFSLLYQITHIYTFESSFYGYSKDSKKIPFGIEQYKSLGASLCLGLNSFLEFESFVEQKIEQKIETSNYNKYLKELKENNILLNMGQGIESGSQSKPEEFEVDIHQISKNWKGQTENQVIVINGANRFADEMNLDQDIGNTLDPHRKLQNHPTPRASSTNPISRKTNRKIKVARQFTRNQRQLRVLEISRVNSVLPDKYQFGLQPVNNVSMSLNPTQPPVEDRRLSVQRRRNFRKNTGAQTDLLNRQQWSELRNYNEADQSLMKPRLFSSKYNQLKYISLASTRVKNAMALRLEMMPRPLDQVFKGKIQHRESQTMYTCLGLWRKIEEEDRPGAITERQMSKASRDKMRSVLVSRRQSPDILTLEKDIGLSYVKGRKINMHIFNQKSFLMVSKAQQQPLHGKQQPYSLSRKHPTRHQ